MKAAVLQINSVNDETVNCSRIESLLREAGARGAEFALLPEVAFFRGVKSDRPPDSVEGRAAEFLRRIAGETGLTIHVGSIAESVPGEDRCYNTSFLVRPSGVLEGVYRKAHLFDVDLPDLRVMESESFLAGSEQATATLGRFTIGMTICYDLRFPALWSALVDRGADLFVCPANFTYKTGEAHWEILLRARAIETQSYVLAAGQWGPHPGRDFSAFGRSMIIDPWGSILCEAGTTDDSVLVADLDPETVASIRSRMPVRRHRRPEVY